MLSVRGADNEILNHVGEELMARVWPSCYLGWPDCGVSFWPLQCTFMSRGTVAMLLVLAIHEDFTATANTPLGQA